MNEYQQKAHDILLRVKSTYVHISAIRHYVEAGVYAVLALVEELREIRECMQEEQAYRARGL